MTSGEDIQFDLERKRDTDKCSISLCIHGPCANIKCLESELFHPHLEPIDHSELDGLISAALFIMKFLSITLLFVLPFFSGVVVSLEGFGSVPAAVKSHGAPVPDSYIVTFKGLVSSSAVSSHHKWLEGMLAASSAVVGGKVPGVVHKYDIGSFKAYSGVFSKDVVEMLKKQGDV